MENTKTKRINVALQGGGAHGAFTWGVLDKIIEDGRLEIEGLSATSAGSMNAVVYAWGKMTGGPDGARQALHDFWQEISKAGAIYSPIQHTPVERLLHGNPLGPHGLSFWMFDTLARMLSPYQFNPFNFNPLKDILVKCIDFEEIVKCECVDLFISTTNVRSGQVRVFVNKEITLDVVLASCSLPYLFQAVEIQGDHYWDGGYMGNPALFPLFYYTKSRDIVIIHINPMRREEIPTTAPEITNRINEITFNSSLLKELRAIAFVVKLLEEDMLKEQYRSQFKHVLVHSIRADDAVHDLSVVSKFDSDWEFLTSLRDKGRETAARWLDENYRHIGKRATVDLKKEYLGIGAQRVG